MPRKLREKAARNTENASGRRMGNSHKRREELETVYRDCCERKVRKENMETKTTITMVNVTPDDRNAKRRTTTCPTDEGALVRHTVYDIGAILIT